MGASAKAMGHSMRPHQGSFTYTLGTGGMTKSTAKVQLRHRQVILTKNTYMMESGIRGTVRVREGSLHARKSTPVLGCMIATIRTGCSSIPKWMAREVMCMKETGLWAPKKAWVSIETV